MWDPLGSCSCYHGVTAVVMSNCGFTLSPCRPADRQWYAECLSYVEDISTDAMSAGIDWTWETFPEYLAAVAKRPKALNHGMYIGHSGVRMYVMGRRALTDMAIEPEVAQMKKLAPENMRPVMFGVISSRQGENPALRRELAQASGKHPVEVMLDLARKNDNQVFVQPIVNEDRAQLRQMLKHDDVLATFSDSGAQVAQETGSLLQTHMLNYWVKRTGEVTLEAEVKKMTHDMAQAFEFGGRGSIKEGYQADLDSFEADRFRPAMPTIERGEHTGAIAGQMVMGGGTENRA